MAKSSMQSLICCATLREDERGWSRKGSPVGRAWPDYDLYGDLAMGNGSAGDEAAVNGASDECGAGGDRCHIQNLTPGNAHKSDGRALQAMFQEGGHRGGVNGGLRERSCPVDRFRLLFLPKSEERVGWFFRANLSFVHGADPRGGFLLAEGGEGGGKQDQAWKVSSQATLKEPLGWE
jgi:hypothetical protein